MNEPLRDRSFCGLRSKETQKKLLTEEHTLDVALKVAVGAEAAEKDVAAFSQDSSASVNKVDSRNCRSFQPTQRRKGPGKRGKFNSSGSKTGTHVLSVNTEITLVLLAVKLVTSRRHAKGNLRKCNQIEGSEPPQLVLPMIRLILFLSCYTT